MRFVNNGNIDKDTALKQGFAYCTNHNFGIYEKRFHEKHCISCQYLLQNNGHVDKEDKRYVNNNINNIAKSNTIKNGKRRNGLY
ncbi:hypothetical protein HYZ41_04140 [archaeon]|nr:hypothetical protein [archaeon]